MHKSKSRAPALSFFSFSMSSSTLRTSSEVSLAAAPALSLTLSARFLTLELLFVWLVASDMSMALYAFVLGAAGRLHKSERRSASCTDEASANAQRGGERTGPQCCSPPSRRQHRRGAAFRCVRPMTRRRTQHVRLLRREKSFLCGRPNLRKANVLELLNLEIR